MALRLQTGEKEASIIHETWFSNSLSASDGHQGGTDLLSHLICQKCSHTWGGALSACGLGTGPDPGSRSPGG